MDVEILKRVELFQHMTSSQLLKLQTCLREAPYAAHTYIFREGHQGSGMFVIAEGKVRISQMIPGLGEEAITILGTGDYFGEMALVEESTRSADAIAHSDCMLYELHREQFDYLIFTDRELMVTLLWSFVRTLSSRLRNTNAKLQSIIALSSYGIK